MLNLGYTPTDQNLKSKETSESGKPKSLAIPTFFLLIPQLMACKYTIFQNKTIRTPQQSQGVMGRISLLLRPKVQVRSVVQPPSADQ